CYPLALHDALPILDALVRLDGNFRLGVVQRLQPLDTAIGGRAVDDDPAKVSTGLTAQALVGIAQSVQIIPVYSYETETDHNSPVRYLRSEEHTSELQSREKLVCRL